MGSLAGAGVAGTARCPAARLPAEAGDCPGPVPRPSWLADRGPAATPLARPPTARHGQRQGLFLPRARICEPAGAPQAMRPGQEKTSVEETPEPAVPRRPAARLPGVTATLTARTDRGILRGLG